MASSTLADSRPVSSVTPPRKSGRGGSLLAICWRQWRHERNLRRRGIDFRSTHPDVARRAYAAMTPAEFAAINGRQTWANLRTIERSLDGLLPDRPVFALDLGSGNGGSTICLAGLLPAGSRIIGIELAETLVEVARKRSQHRADDRSSLEFVIGSVIETFRDPTGEPVAAGSVDLVNASGILGHHLDRPDVATTATEIARVLKPGGIAALDVGPKLAPAALTELMTRLDFTRLRRTRSNPFDRTGQVVFWKGEK